MVHRLWVRMIYGPYSTGWRDECRRMSAKRRAGWVGLGCGLTLALALIVYGGIGLLLL